MDEEFQDIMIQSGKPGEDYLNVLAWNNKILNSTLLAMCVTQPYTWALPHLLKAGSDRRPGPLVSVWQLVVTQRGDGHGRYAGWLNFEVRGGLTVQVQVRAHSWHGGKNPSRISTQGWLLARRCNSSFISKARCQHSLFHLLAVTLAVCHLQMLGTYFKKWMSLFL